MAPAQHAYVVPHNTYVVSNNTYVVPHNTYQPRTTKNYYMVVLLDGAKNVEKNTRFVNYPVPRVVNLHEVGLAEIRYYSPSGAIVFSPINK